MSRVYKVGWFPHLQNWGWFPAFTGPVSLDDGGLCIVLAETEIQGSFFTRHQIFLSVVGLLVDALSPVIHIGLYQGYFLSAGKILSIVDWQG